MAGAAHAIGTIEPGDAPAGVNPAASLVVNNDGVGHVNIVPYYSVQNGGDTYINVVNTDTANGKAVKVRFRSASNSDDVFDFTLLLSPGDVFAMAVTAGADGIPKVVTQDKTCTLPNNINGRSFVFDRLNPSLTAEGKAREASEGYVELLTMADIPKITDPDTDTLYESIKHSNGVPLNCNSAAVRALLDDPANGSEANDLGLYAPTTGLFTNWTLINVARATSHTGAAVAVEGRDSDGAPGYAGIVFWPQTADPIANPEDYTSDPVLAGGVDRAGDSVDPAVAAASYDFPDLSTPLAGGSPAVQAAILSYAIAVTTVANEYTTDPSLEARTDWVFSSPTRRYATAMAYGAGADDTDVQVFAADGSFFYDPSNTSVVGGQICVKGIEFGVGGAAVTGDREERFAQSDEDFVISPGTPAAPRVFCGEVSVLTFNGGTSVLGAEVAVTDLDTQGFADGWARLGTPGLGLGLPIVGYSAVELVNSAVAEGTAGNFGQSFPHRVTRSQALLPD
ncbi:MAG: cell surface protein [Rubrivivax sp.]|nr:cell surface protein [Rubrivivax sp.]